MDASINACALLLASISNHGFMTLFQNSELILSSEVIFLCTVGCTSSHVDMTSLVEPQG